MKHLLYIIAVVLALSTLASCRVDDARYLEYDELGTTQKNFYAGTTSGSLKVNVYANKEGTARLLEGEDWASIANPTFSSDTEIRVDYLYNEGFPRKARIELATDSRRDTVTILQYGLQEEIFSLPKSSVIAYNGTGSLDVPLTSNVDLQSVHSKLMYLDGDGWIRSIVFAPDKITLGLEDNPDPVRMRKARIVLTRQTGWDEQQTQTLFLTQPASTNILGTPVTFEELRDMVSSSVRLPLAEDYSLTAYVVSDPSSGNVGENAVLEMNNIDYDAEDETVYIESLDGKYGFRLRTSSAKENVFKPNTKISLILNGASIQKETDPVRYSLYDISSSMLISSEEVPASELPSKKKFIGDLTDDDIYTYVSLQDCEIPVRKGCLTPINEGYTRLYSSNRISKFPILVRDARGSSLYLYTNTTCPYRRTGTPLPHGSGTLSGIVVHEKYRSFIDKDNPNEDLCGNIGRYQLRHMRYSDIDLAESQKQSFSVLLTEYRYLRIPEPNPDRHWIPTYGDNGWFSHSRTAFVHGQWQVHCWPYVEYAYLGPCGSSHKGDTSNGYGIILEDGTNYGVRVKANPDGKGQSAIDVGLCWCNTQWKFNTGMEAWLICFSTEGIRSDVVSMQLATHNISQNLRAPRYWKAEWSLSGNMKADDWQLIGEYVVPDVVINDNTLMNQSAGFKQIDFPLPTTILGHKAVYIRLMPTRDAASSGYDYDQSPIVNGNGNAISYFAIRYNK